MSCHTPHLDARCRRAEKDIKPTIQTISADLAVSLFEKCSIAEDRTLMRRPLDEAVWELCNADLSALNRTLFHAMEEASSSAVRRGEDVAKYMGRWVAAWVSSPVSTRLLRAMQTLMDGSIFQVREDLLHCIFQYTASQIACTAEQAELYYPGVTPGITVLGVPCIEHLTWPVPYRTSQFYICLLPPPLQLNPAGSARVASKLMAAETLGRSCEYLIPSDTTSFIWPHWPALRALLLPRLRLIYNGLAALIGSPGLGVDNGRKVMDAIVLLAGMTANITASVYCCGGGEKEDTAPDPLVAELAQVLVHPQFLNMVQAGEAWSRQHAHLDLIHLYSVPVSACLEAIADFGMQCLRNSFCMDSPSPMDPSSPKLLQAAFSWFAAALQMIQAGGWQGPWPTDCFLHLLNPGLVVPLVIMLRRAQAEAERIPQPLLPWADRPRCLECAMQAAEWMLSSASKGEQWEDGVLLDMCSDLVTALDDSGVGQGMMWGASQRRIAYFGFKLLIMYSYKSYCI